MKDVGVQSTGKNYSHPDRGKNLSSLSSQHSRFDMQMLDIQFQFKRFPIYREKKKVISKITGGRGEEMKLIKIN